LDEGLPEEFWRELEHYPRVDHDDALDATAGAVELALQAARRGIGETLAVVPRRAKPSAY
jgi:phage terminase large subunit-like protein